MISGRDRGILAKWSSGWHSRNRRQRLNRHRLVAHAKHRVGIHRQVDVGMPSKQLGRLGRHAGAGQVCDERLPQGMEIGVMAAFVDVGDACPLEVFPDHLCRVRVGNVKERHGRMEPLLRADPLSKLCRKIRPQRKDVTSAVLRMACIDGQGWRNRLEVKRLHGNRADLVPSVAGVGGQSIQDHPVRPQNVQDASGPSCAALSNLANSSIDSGRRMRHRWASRFIFDRCINRSSGDRRSLTSQRVNILMARR